MSEVLAKILPIRVEKDYFNVLNQFHNYTYNWRFFMVNELQLKKNLFDFVNSGRIPPIRDGNTINSSAQSVNVGIIIFVRGGCA